MMGITDRYFRLMMRLLCPGITLYTEMVVDQALVNCRDPARLIGDENLSDPPILQLGGSCPETLEKASALGVALGYRRLNLNVGCPSHRVKGGGFGACLMLDPARVAACVQVMAAHASVSIKTRLGVDDQPCDHGLRALMTAVRPADVSFWVVHARKAWLSGLDPKQNRNIPPLNYEAVRRIKAEAFDRVLVINGGILNPQEALSHLSYADGVMIGRAMAHDPLLWRTSAQTPEHLLVAYLERAWRMAECEGEQGRPLARLLRPLLGWFRGQKGALSWRQAISAQIAGRQGSLADRERLEALLLQKVHDIHNFSGQGCR